MTSRALDLLQHEADLAPDFSLWKSLPAKAAQYADFPAALDGRIVATLASRGVERLYTHQAEAISHILDGNNCVVVTPTASGKTMCYNLPVLNAMLDDPE